MRRVRWMAIAGLLALLASSETVRAGPLGNTARRAGQVARRVLPRNCGQCSARRTQRRSAHAATACSHCQPP